LKPFDTFTPACCLWWARGASSFNRRAAAMARWPMLKGRWLLVSNFFVFVMMLKSYLKIDQRLTATVNQEKWCRVCTQKNGGPVGSSGRRKPQKLTPFPSLPIFLERWTTTIYANGFFCRLNHALDTAYPRYEPRYEPRHNLGITKTRRVIT